MDLPKFKLLKNLSFNQKVSLLSLGVLALILPLLSSSVQTQIRTRKMAASPPVIPTPAPVVACNQYGKGLFAVHNFTRSDGYPGILVSAVSNTLYSNPALKITQAGSSGSFIGDVPAFSQGYGGYNWGLYYQWYWSTVRPVSENYKLELYINHTSSDDGSPCGEWISSPSPTPTQSQKVSRVFITSTTYNGDLGGLAGADAKCQERANAAKLGGVWKAWLSDSSASASSRLSHSNDPYKLLNGQIVANNWADLTDGSIQNAINVTELNTIPSYMSCVWTQTTTLGTIRPLVSNITACANFTASDMNYAYCGRNGSTDFNWTEWPSTDRCDQKHPLYCFEQPVSTPTPTRVPTPIPTNIPGCRTLRRACWSPDALCCSGLVCKDDGVGYTRCIPK